MKCMNEVFILKVRVWKEEFYRFRKPEIMTKIKPVKLIGFS